MFFAQRANLNALGLGREGAAFVCAACVIFLSGFLHDVDGAASGIWNLGGKVELSRGGPRVPAAGVLDDLIADLRGRTQDGDSIVVLPWYPVLYFLAERENPTRFDWLFPGYLQSEAEVARLVDAIDRSPARVVVYSPSAIDGDSERSLAGFAPSIDRYLRRNFRPIKRYGRFIVMERGRRGRQGLPGAGR